MSFLIDNIVQLCVVLTAADQQTSEIRNILFSQICCRVWRAYKTHKHKILTISRMMKTVRDTDSLGIADLNEQDKHAQVFISLTSTLT